MEVSNASIVEQANQQNKLSMVCLSVNASKLPETSFSLLIDQEELLQAQQTKKQRLLHLLKHHLYHQMSKPQELMNFYLILGLSDEYTISVAFVISFIILIMLFLYSLSKHASTFYCEDPGESTDCTIRDIMKYVKKCGKSF